MKDILMWLAIGGMIAIAATSPYFVKNLFRVFQNKRKYKKQSVSNAFYRLKKQGCINIKERNHQIFISLTPEGKRRAGIFQINDLQIKKPKRWDGKWRIIIFDIEEKGLGRTKRNALRGFLIRLGFYPLQQSVWVLPYYCHDELTLLRAFFGFTTNQVRLLLVETIEDDSLLRKNFTLS